MTDEVDESVSLQELHLLRAIARVTGRPPRIIEIPPPCFGWNEHDNGRQAGKKGTNG